MIIGFVFGWFGMGGWLSFVFLGWDLQGFEFMFISEPDLVGQFRIRSGENYEV